MSKPLDRLALLETFVRIAERGSISAAARDLGLSQGSASRQLAALEDRLAVQLIRRTTHSLALTEAGLEVLADARALIGRWEALEERHAADAQTLKGPLRVVAPVALGQMHLADIAVGFQATHPEVSIHWRLEDEPIRFAEIGCDCWIKIGPIPDESLIVRHLGRVERLLVASPALAGRCQTAQNRQQAQPEDVQHLPFVTLTPFEGSKIGLFGPEGARMEWAVSPTLSTNNIFSLKRAVLSGLGAAILPRWFVAEDLAAGSLVDLLPDWRAKTLNITLAYLPARQQPRRLSAFIAALEAGCRAIPGIER
ncbi:MAG: LysR family transcriptional regulator [Rhodospirillaceae bacterium]